jgi:hypothetical protein
MYVAPMGLSKTGAARIATRLAGGAGIRFNARMKRLFCALVSLFCAAPAQAGDAPSTIPLSIVSGANDGARVYAPVRIGTLAGRMRLDTGASTSRLALAPWNKEFPVLGAARSQGASGSAIDCEDVEIDVLALRASQGNDVARARHVATRCAGGEDLLGLNFFRGARFILDFSRSELRFFDPPRAGRRAHAFQSLGPAALLGLDARLGSGSGSGHGSAPVVGLFDAGAELCAVDRPFLLTHRRLFAPVAAGKTARDASGGRMDARLFKIKTLDLGEGRVFHDVVALVYDFGGLRTALGGRAPVIFGANLLRRLNWDVDLTNPAAPNWDAAPN